jgi:hypothetical protein
MIIEVDGLYELSPRLITVPFESPSCFIGMVQHLAIAFEAII